MPQTVNEEQVAELRCQVQYSCNKELRAMRTALQLNAYIDDEKLEHSSDDLTGPTAGKLFTLETVSVYILR